MGWDNANSEFIFGSNVSYISNTITVNDYGNIRADYFIGNGAQLTYLTGANVTGNVANADFSTNANFAAFAGNVTASSQPNITTLGTLTNVSVTGNVVSGNANLGNLVFGNYFIGDGSNLSNISAGNVVGTVNYAANATNADVANVALSVSNAAQPNITSVGILTSLSITGDVKSGNANLVNAATANFFIGSGANLYDIAAANIVGDIPTSNFAAYAGNITVSSQPNITTVGVLSSLSVSGNIKSGNANLGNAALANFFIGSGANLYDIAAANIIGELPNANYATYSDQANSADTATTAVTAGTVTDASQPNITSIGTLGILSVTGNIRSGNANLGNTVTANFFVGSGNNLSNIQAANITGTVANATFSDYAEQSNTANAALVAGTVTTAAQPNITSVGTLTSLSVSGTATIGNINSAGNISIAGNVTAANFLGNFSGNITGNVAAPGNTTEIIFNNAGNTAASNALTFNNSTNVVALTGNISVTGNISRDNKNVPTYVAQSGAPSNPNIGDEWYDTDNDVTYQYVYNGVTYQWVDVTTGYINANTTAVANTLVLRDANGSFYSNILYANGGNFTGAVYSTASTSFPTQLATKEYVDQQTSTGIHIHTPVRVKTTGPLTASYTPGGTALTVNTISSGTLFTTSTNHGLSINDMIISGSTTNGLTAGTPYFVFSTPALNTFELSATYAGDLLTTFTDGTGLIINITSNPGVGAKLTNSGATVALVIDTITLGVTNRVLVASQTNAFENGVYTVTDTGSISTNWELTRATDADRYLPFDPAGIGEGDYFFVTEGFVGTGDSFVLTTPGVIILGTTNLTYTQFSAAITYSGVSPIKIEGQSISLANTTGTGDYVVLANSPQLNTPNIGNATGVSLSLTGNLTSGNAELGNLANASFLSGTLITASQPNISAVGTLSNLSVSGNITSGNADLGNVATANFFTGTLTTNSQPNITSLGTLSDLSVTGNANVGRLYSSNANLGNTANANFFIGDGGFLTNISAASGSYLQNGNSNVYVDANSNVRISITGVPNVVVFTDLGANINGYANITGDLDAGNITSAGNINFTGPNVYFSNISNLHIPGGTANYAIVTDGLGNLSWALAGSGNANVAGSNTQIQFNDDNVLGASANLTFNKTSNTLSTTILSITGNANVGSLNASNISAGGNIVTTGQIATTKTGNASDGAGQLYLNGTGNNRIDFNTNGLGAPAFTTRSDGTKITLYPALTGSSVDYGLGVAAGTAWFSIPGYDAGQFFKWYGGETAIASLGGTGILSVSGNITGANINTGGDVSAIGNANVGNVYTSIISASSNVTGANINTGGDVSAIGNANVGNVYTSIISASSNITGANINTGGIISATGNANVGNVNTATISASSNITGANINTGGIISATGNANVGNINTANASVTGNFSFSGSNFYLPNIANFHIPGGTANYAIITDGTGNLTWGLAGTGNANVAGSNTQIQFNDEGNLGASANLTFNKSSNTLSTTILSTTGNANVGNVYTSIVSASSNITGANLNTGGIISATGNANVGNVYTSIVSASGNVTFTGANVNLGAVGNLTISGGSPNYVLSTDGAGNLSWQAGGSGTGNAITFGNSNVSIGSSGANVTFGVNGNANVLQVTGTGAIISGTGSVTGNLTVANANLGNVASANFITGTLTTNSQPNITGVGTLTSLTIGPNSSLIMSGNTGYVRANSLQGRDGSQAVYLYYGNVSGSVGIVGDLTVGASGTGNLIVANGNATFSGANVDLGSVSNIHISGGSLNYVLTSDGAGNVSWNPPAGGGGVSGSNTQLQYNAAGVFAGTPGLTFDNTANRLTLQNYAVIRNQLGNVIGSRTINLNLGGYVSATSTGITTWAFTNPTASPNASGFVLELTNGGSFVQVWPTTVRWPSSIPPTLTTTGVDLLVFITDDGGLNWRGSLVMIDSR
jgi:hypothetical protein